MKVSERLCELRNERKETRRQAALCAGISGHPYQRFESGKPGFDAFFAPDGRFGVTPDYLAGRSGKR